MTLCTPKFVPSNSYLRRSTAHSDFYPIRRPAHPGFPGPALKPARPAPAPPPPPRYLSIHRGFDSHILLSFLFFSPESRASRATLLLPRRLPRPTIGGVATRCPSTTARLPRPPAPRTRRSARGGLCLGGSALAPLRRFAPRPPPLRPPPSLLPLQIQRGKGVGATLSTLATPPPSSSSRP